jgi:mono/diheme cytochrome c family protein/glucose/arabinose dehydrogenase
MLHRLILPLLALAPLSIVFAESKVPIQNERIVLIGNGLGERMAGHPYWEARLQMSHPGLGLSLRNLCRAGDTPGFRPHPSRNSQWAFPGAGKFHPQHQTHAGDGFHPTPDQWLADLKPDTLIAFFGYNESFDGPAGIANFKGELDAWIKHTQAQKYNGKAAPRIVLVSPIAYENLSKSRDLPDGRSENSNLALYTQAMAEVAKATGIEFVDVYKPTHDLYPTLKKPFTRNGFLPNDDGYRLLSEMLVKAIYGDAPVKTKASPKDVLAAIADKEWFWSNDFSMLNGVHVDGRRYNPFGPQNYPDEKKKIRQMIDLRDQATWAMVSGKSFDLAAADKATHPLPPVDTNYNNGTTEYKYGEEAEKTITTPEGYQAKLFASEKEFPNLANPMQISFDNKGRLWVATMPTYPHYRPGDPLPDDKLLIYEDTNGDGKADKETVFADKLHLPIGFEFVPGGVYISQEPHLVFLGDTDGDDKADVREVVLTGFDSHDTHHAISAYAADPSGAFMMCEGIFLHSNVETPYGPVRGVDGGFYRFCPQKTKLERTIQMGIPNPWGFAFDDWGQDFLIHTSGPTWNWALPVSLNPISYGAQAPATADLVPGGQSVRPTSGLEFVSSRHFPDEVQGDALIGNCIGFLGLKQHSIVEDGTGYKTGFRHELMKSSDGNFRPADFEFAPDGSLYVIDWHNVLIGHMQHNARDPLRDHVHGRIYRITYPARPLVKPATVDGAPIATLLENLKLPEYRTRYRSRRELREHPVDQVIPAVQKWVASLDANDPNNAHQQLEALWVTWGMNAVDTDLLRKLIIHSDHRVRCATVRVLRYNFDKFSDTLDLLKKAASDDHGRVRLEAVVAATWYNKSGALEVVNIAQGKGADGWSQKPIEAATARLQGKVEKKETENPLPPIPEYLTSAEKEAFKAGHEVYFRDGHCATCHQKEGKGLDPAFPPLHDSIFVHGSPERLIKLTLHGVMGPFELHGKKYDGQVPMTPFGGIINDKEMAAVLTYVRNTYGNKASAITPEQVAKVREATKDMKGFYQMDALLKEHPLEK